MALAPCGELLQQFFLYYDIIVVVVVWLRYCCSVIALYPKRENSNSKFHIIRAIFNLSNKIALLILLRMYVCFKCEKKQFVKTKIDNMYKKNDIFGSTQLDLALFSFTRINHLTELFFTFYRLRKVNKWWIWS